MPEESTFYLAIAASFFGFIALAFVLLYPIYRFMRKEEHRSSSWTEPAIAERQRRALERSERGAVAGDGAGGDGTRGSAGGEGGPGDPPELRT